MSAQGVDVQNLVKIYLAVMNLRMRDKTRFLFDFTNISIYPFSIPYFVRATGHILGRF